MEKSVRQRACDSLGCCLRARYLSSVFDPVLRHTIVAACKTIIKMWLLLHSVVLIYRTDCAAARASPASSSTKQKGVKDTCPDTSMLQEH